MSALPAQALQFITGLQRPRYVLVALATVLALVAAAIVAAIVTSGAAPLPSATAVAESGEETEGRGADAAGEVSATALPVVTSEVFLARDPFKPVVPEEEQPAPVSDASDPLANPSDPNAPSPVVPSDPDAPIPVTPSDPDAPSCLGQEELVCDGQVVTLLDTAMVDDELFAVIKVGTTIHEVTVGEKFAEAFVLLAIDPPTVTIGYGDETKVLLPGASVLK